MKYNKQEIIAAVKNANAIEVYEYQFNNGNVHTDNLKYVGNGMFDNTEIESIPFDENGEADVDIFVMDADEYNRTINANNCETETENGIGVIIIRM